MSVRGKQICAEKDVIKVRGRLYVCSSDVEEILNGIDTNNEEEILMALVFLNELCVPEK